MKLDVAGLAHAPLYDRHSTRENSRTPYEIGDAPESMRFCNRHPEPE